MKKWLTKGQKVIIIVRVARNNGELQKSTTKKNFKKVVDKRNKMK
ncbi:hypothetical protein [Alkalibaculum bacchi]|nr:hypothetical protein [Alkalibaculum bacchi]